MNLFIKLLVAFTFFSSFAYAENIYLSSRCDHRDDSVFEKVIGNFKKIQKKCCEQNILIACEQRAVWQKCNNVMYVTGSDVSCTEACQAFTDDCKEVMGVMDGNKILTDH